MSNEKDSEEENPQTEETDNLANEKALAETQKAIAEAQKNRSALNIIMESR